MYKEYRHMSCLYKEYRHMLHFSVENILLETQAGQISLWNSSSMRKCMRDWSTILVFGALWKSSIWALFCCMKHMLRQCWQMSVKNSWSLLKVRFYFATIFQDFCFYFVYILDRQHFSDHLLYRTPEIQK